MLNDCPTCKWCSGNNFSKSYLISGIQKSGFICNCLDVINQFQLAQIRGYALVRSSVVIPDTYNCKYEPKECIKQKINICYKCRFNSEVFRFDNGLFCVRCSNLLCDNYGHSDQLLDNAINVWNSNNPKVQQITSNQGLTHCFKCNTKTVKVSTGFYSIYDICPVCKI